MISCKSTQRNFSKLSKVQVSIEDSFVRKAISYKGLLVVF